MSKWWAAVPRTTQTDRDEPDNVVQHPGASLDAQARRIRDLENQLVDAEAELTRVRTRYNTIRSDLIRAREQLCDTLKESGIKAEFVRPRTLE